MQRYYSASFLGGFIVLSLELLGFRVLAPYFGYSLYVYGALIGVVLAALSLGYWIGGIWGDREKPLRAVSLWVLGSAVYLGLLALIFRQLLTLLSGFPILLGCVIAVILLFFMPMAVLAALSPYLIKRLSAEESVGRSAGAIYALSTFGSFAGTFVTVLWAVPALGVRNVFLLNAVLTLCVALCLYFSRRAAATTLLLISAMQAVPLSEARSLAVSESESFYNHLEVVDYGSAYGLRTERRHHTLYSYVPKDGVWPYQFALYDFFAIPPLLNDAKQGLLLGLGAGMGPLLHEEANPDLRFVAVDIDPAIVELGRKYFHLNERTNLDRIEIADARPFLTRSKEIFDFIEIDLFSGGVEIPFYLVTREFFGSTLTHLSSRGMFAMNVYDPSHGLLVGPIANTLAAAYPYAYSVDAGNGSYLLVASRAPVDVSELYGRRSEFPAPLAKRIEEFKERITRIELSPEEQVFTDDRAPIEKITQNVFKD